MTAKLLIDLVPQKWVYTLVLDPKRQYVFGTGVGADVQLPSGTGSPNHAAVKFADTWFIEDLLSETGTFVNGKRVERQVLTDQDFLKVGPCEIQFQNPEAAAAKTEQDRTRQIAEKYKTALEKSAEETRAGKLASGPGVSTPSPDGSRGTTPALPDLDADTLPLSAKKSAASSKTQDMLWATQKLTDIMSQVLSRPGTRDETYTLMLDHLRHAIQADTGFVMIPNSDKTRWVIRAWIGDSSSWTKAEKEHPIPLTVTNKAYESSSVVSNALADQGEEIQSQSLKALQVSSYIAVPLMKHNERRGVLYFDTRNSEKKFGYRDVKLLHLAGGFILDIEDKAK